MRITYNNIFVLLTAALLCGVALPSRADDFDPTNPAEPNAYFRLTTMVSPSGAGSTSGSGWYMEGSSAGIRTSANSNYVFNHWERKSDGLVVGSTSSCTYTTRALKDTLVAVYDFNPVSPAEPSYSNAYRLYLTTNIEGACSFNRTSGNKVEADAYVSLSATVSSGYNFVGWYEQGVLVSTSRSFTYQMGSHETTLEAQLQFNPLSPSEPGYVDYTETGDLNDDGSIDVSDVVALVSNYVNGTTGGLQMSVADVNHDGAIDVSDIVALVNKYLNE